MEGRKQHIPVYFNLALVCAVGAAVCIVTGTALVDIPAIAKVFVYVAVAMLTIANGTGLALSRR